MPVETFEIRRRERGPRKGAPVYAVPPGQSIRLLGRASLDGLWPRDLPLLFLILAPRESWGEAAAEWELYVASLLSTRGGPALQYRHQPTDFQFGVASWLRDRRDSAFVDVLRESLPLGAFPRDVEAGLVRLEFPELPGGVAAGPGPFRGRMHAFLKEGYCGAGWMSDEPRDWPEDLGAGAAMARRVDLYLPEGPAWGQGVEGAS